MIKVDKIRGCTWYIIASNKLSAPIELRQYYYHCIKYARIQVFIDSYSPVYCLYTGEYGSVKTRIFAYFTLKSIDWFLYEGNTGIGNTGIMLELIRNEKKRINWNPPQSTIRLSLHNHKISRSTSRLILSIQVWSSRILQCWYIAVSLAYRLNVEDIKSLFSAT